MKPREDSLNTDHAPPAEQRRCWELPWEEVSGPSSLVSRLLHAFMPREYSENACLPLTNGLLATQKHLFCYVVRPQ